MVNVRQRINSNSVPHTRREFRQLQQQNRDRESSGSKPAGRHRASQVVDEKGIPYVTSSGREPSGPPWTPSAFTAFKALLTARLFAAVWSFVSDCDESYNYWDPMHYLIYGKGMQTWEYAPAYALRSYAYLLVHAVPAWCYAQVVRPNRMYVFYLVRCALAAVCAGCESYFYVGVSREVGANVGRITLATLLFSAGMFVSSTAFLPSTTSMYLCMVAHGAWFQQSYGLAIFATALSAFLSWPFAAILGIPIAWDVLLRKKKYAFFAKVSAVSAAAVLIPQILLDSDHYGKLTLAPLNIVAYNVFSSSHGGPDLYGTEPWTFYLANGCLNFNVAFIAALLVWPLQGLLHLAVRLPERGAMYLPASLSQLALYQWLSVFWLQPHKEERFLFPAYPLICLAAALAVDTAQKLWYSAFVRVKAKHYLHHTQWMSLAFIATTAVLGMSRIAALYQNYHAPIDVWMHVSHMGRTEPLYEPGQRVNVCVGKEWHRFPSSFFLPNNDWHLQFIRSGFRGQLPQPYAEGDPDATKRSRANFNDANREEESRYVDPAGCDFLVDFENGDASELEPVYSADPATWEPVTSHDFLDAPRCARLLRAFYVPFTRTEDNCRFGRYVLLRNVRKQRAVQQKKLYNA